MLLQKSKCTPVLWASKELHLTELSSCCLFWDASLIRCNIYTIYCIMSIIYLFFLFLFLVNYLPLLHFKSLCTDWPEVSLLACLSYCRASVLRNLLCSLSFAFSLPVPCDRGGGIESQSRSYSDKKSQNQSRDYCTLVFLSLHTTP